MIKTPIRFFEVRGGKLEFESLNPRNQEIKYSKSKISHF